MSVESLAHESERRLWERSSTDPECFAEIFRRHAQRVHSYCFFATGDDSVADDLTSVVFLEAWRQKGRVTLLHDSSLPWLLGVARNCARNAARSARRHRHALAQIGAGESWRHSEEEVVDRLDARLSLEAARASLSRLSPSEREVIYLVSWCGLTYHETAQALGVPVGTVRSRLSRARERARATGLETNQIEKETL